MGELFIAITNYSFCKDDYDEWGMWTGAWLNEYIFNDMINHL